jgi:hypothetical protein
MTSLKRSVLCLVVAVGLVAILSAPVWADYTWPTPSAPPPIMQSLPGALVVYPPGILARNLQLSNPSNMQSLPPLGSPPATIDSFFDVFTEVSLDGGQTWMPETATAIARIRESPTLPSLYDTEMLQLDISGGTLPAGAMIRESPTKASLGQTSVTDIGGGQYRIGSFFDIFTELSVDGGQTWAPATVTGGGGAGGSLRVVATPEPGTFALLGIGAIGLLAYGWRRRARGA